LELKKTEHAVRQSAEATTAPFAGLEQTHPFKQERPVTASASSISQKKMKKS